MVQGQVVHHGGVDRIAAVQLDHRGGVGQGADRDARIVALLVGVHGIAAEHLPVADLLLGRIVPRLRLVRLPIRSRDELDVDPRARILVVALELEARLAVPEVLRDVLAADDADAEVPVPAVAAVLGARVDADRRCDMRRALELHADLVGVDLPVVPVRGVAPFVVVHRSHVGVGPVVVDAVQRVLHDHMVDAALIVFGHLGREARDLGAVPFAGVSLVLPVQVVLRPRDLRRIDLATLDEVVVEVHRDGPGIAVEHGRGAAVPLGEAAPVEEELVALDRARLAIRERVVERHLRLHAHGPVSAGRHEVPDHIRAQALGTGGDVVFGIEVARSCKRDPIAAVEVFEVGGVRHLAVTERLLVPRAGIVRILDQELQPARAARHVVQRHHRLEIRPVAGAAVGIRHARDVADLRRHIVRDLEFHPVLVDRAHPVVPVIRVVDAVIAVDDLGFEVVHAPLDELVERVDDLGHGLSVLLDMGDLGRDVELGTVVIPVVGGLLLPGQMGVPVDVVVVQRAAVVDLIGVVERDRLRSRIELRLGHDAEEPVAVHVEVIG